MLDQNIKTLVHYIVQQIVTLISIKKTMNLNLHNRLPYFYPVTSLIDTNGNYIYHLNKREQNESVLSVEKDKFHSLDEIKDTSIYDNTHLSRQIRQIDLDAAADSGYGSHSGYGSGHSGYGGHSSYGSGHSGYGSHSSYGGHSSYESHGKSEYYCPEGIPVETALFALLAAAGLSFGVLFMAITMITGMKRRKRGTPSLESENGYALPIYSEMFSQVLWEGM